MNLMGEFPKMFALQIVLCLALMRGTELAKGSTSRDGLRPNDLTKVSGYPDRRELTG
jgi:hypothetical protein